jgi:predicted nucleic acid-binding Zn ribbon protein
MGQIGRPGPPTERVMQPIHGFSGGVLAEIVRRQPASKARTSFAWQLAVGPAIARATTVILENGVLRVGAADQRWIREIERSKDVVLLKMQSLLGADQISTLKTRS